jgi:cytochrome c peroxidase
MAEGGTQRTYGPERIFNVAQFWDGRAADLKAQAGGPIQNPIEMGITHEHAIEMLRGIPGYKPLFDAAYPNDKDAITMGEGAAQRPRGRHPQSDRSRPIQ